MIDKEKEKKKSPVEVGKEDGERGKRDEAKLEAGEKLDKLNGRTEIKAET